MPVWQLPQHPYHRIFSKASALNVVCFGGTEQFVAVIGKLEAFNSGSLAKGICTQLTKYDSTATDSEKAIL